MLLSLPTFFKNYKYLFGTLDVRAIAVSYFGVIFRPAGSQITVH